jgi:acyl-CoA thioesterase FadM
MNLFTGVLKIAATEPLKPRIHRLEDGIEVAFRVWPHDLDMNLHMNNAKYLVAMELARWALFFRTGVARLALRNRWAMVNAAQNVTFFRGLHIFQRYTVSCRVLHADDGWLYLEEKVRRRGELVATGLFRMRIKRGPETISPREIARTAGYALPRTDLPADLRAWDQVTEAQIAERQREREDRGPVQND